MNGYEYFDRDILEKKATEIFKKAFAQAVIELVKPAYMAGHKDGTFTGAASIEVIAELNQKIADLEYALAAKKVF